MRAEGDSEAEMAAWKGIFACIVALILVVGAPSVVRYITGVDPITKFGEIAGSQTAVSNLWTLVQAAVGTLAVFGMIWSGVKLSRIKKK